MRVVHRAWVVAFLIASSWVRAGDIYVCKGANGVNVYQSTPCPTPDKEVRHQQYDPAMARAADGSVGATDRIYSSDGGSYSNQGSTGASYGSSPGARHASDSPPAPRESYTPPPPAPEEPAGYRCAAGNRVWIQQAPCPTTYAGANFVDVNGHLMDGTPVRGTGFMHVDKPVQQQQLDHDALCDQVRSGARIGQGGGSDASQSYERNKLKRNLCGG